MKPFWKKRAAEHAGSPPTTTATHPWTNGAHWTTKLTTAGVIACLAAGPVALAVGMLQPGTSAPASVVAKEAGSSPDAQRAGAFGLQYVLAWLRSTRTDNQALKQFVPFSIDGLPDTPLPVADPVVSSVEPGTDGIYSVVIGVRIQEPNTKAKDPATLWQRRFFRVAVTSTGAGLSAGTLPAQVAAPTQAPAFPGLAYQQNVGVSGSVADAAKAFLDAYLTGQGELGRYLSPGVQMEAVSPAPYKTLALQNVVATAEVPTTIHDGDRLDIIATVNLTELNGQGRTSDYPLTIKARAGRWEVTAMPPLPQLSPTPKPSNSTK